MTFKRKPRKAKVAGFMRAQNLINTKGYDVRRAVSEAGISATTYYKYLDIFGDNIDETHIEVLPKSKEVPAKPKQEQTGTVSDLDRLLAENAALVEQLNLRKELAKYVH